MDVRDAANQPPAPTAPTIPAAPLKRRNRFKLALVSGGVLLVIVACLVAGFVKLQGPSNSNQPGPTGLRLHSISMISPEEGWIAGDKPRSHPDKNTYGMTDQNAVEPVILHYKAGRWTEEHLPSNINPYGIDMTLSSIAMVSATEGWASGSTLLPYYPPAQFNGNTVVTIVDGFTLPVLLHYTGGAWTVVEDPPAAPGPMVLSSPREGWAIGGTSFPNSSGPLALRYDGTAWNPVKDPVFASLSMQTLAEAPNGEVWIAATDETTVGRDGDEPLLTMHYDGHTWIRQPANLDNDRFFGMTMVSPTEGWAVGIDPGGTSGHPRGPVQGIIAQYQQGAWQVVKTIASPPGEDYFHLSAVAMLSADTGWAVGQDGVLVQYSKGVWKEAQSLTREDLNSVTFVSASEGWAVGEQGVILHYQGGTWSLYQR
jgi:hypothetical protein